MATEANLNKDEDQNNQPGIQPQSVSGPSSGSGLGSSIPSRATPSGTPNIQSYLKANSQAGQQLAGGITNQAQQQANSFNTNLNNTNNQLNTKANPLQQNLGDNAKNLINTSFQNPQDLLKQQDQLSQFQKLRDQGYQSDINTLAGQAQSAKSQLQGQVNNLNQNAQNANTESGRFQLLRNTFGQPNYSQGQQKLDQLFLQAQPGANQQLNQNLTGISNQAKQNFGATTSNFQSKLNALNNLSAQNAGDIKTGLNTRLGDIGSNVNQEYADKSNTALNNDLALRQAVASNKFTPEQLNQLGLAQGTQTWGLKGNDLLNAGQYEFNPYAAKDQGGAAQAATPEEFARYQALNQLAGNSAPQNIFGTSTEAGFNPFNYNTQSAKDKIESQHQALLSDFTNARDQASQGLLNVGHVGAGESAAWGPGRELAQAKTPEEANAIVTKYMPLFQSFGGSDSPVNPAQQFLNFYNSKYAPAAASQLGVNSPESNPLPFNPATGTIDWSKLPNPTGGAGKGLDITPTGLLPDKKV